MQTSIFRKKKFDHFSLWYIFFTMPFYSRQDIFFCQFSFNTQRIFSVFQSFQENEYDTHFSIFVFFKIKYYPITGKKQNEKPFFLYFFFKLKTHFFFVLTRVKFSSPNHVMQFIDTKRKTSFFIFSYRKITTRVSALLSTCKRNIRTEVSLHVS